MRVCIGCVKFWQLKAGGRYAKEQVNFNVKRKDWLQVIKRK